LLLRTTYCTIESSLQKNGRTNTTDNLPSNLLLLSALPFPALAALTGHQNRPQSSQQTHEMTVPNELIGCIIGKGGSKIAEIRQLSGAMIRISNCEDRESGGNMDRTITISGNAESVALAQYLINMRISMETAAMGGMAGFQYIAPNHIIKTQLH
jgi:hypothetical protein